jgi:5'(3')-deoxyribonucleotidase
MFTLGLDLDGVCADYVAALRSYVAEERGISPSDLPEPLSWRFEDADWGFADQQHFLDTHISAVKNGLFRTMPMIEGASENLWELSEAGVDIRIITHRLVTKHLHATVAADTVSWLDANDIPYRDICFVAKKVMVGADVYLDDAPHNVNLLREAVNTVITYNTLYNDDIPGLRAYGWEDVKTLVLALKDDNLALR